MAKAKTDTVHIHPLPGVAIPPGDFDPPILHIEQDVSADVWERIRQYTPPAFKTSPAKPEPPADEQE